MSLCFSLELAVNNLLTQSYALTVCVMVVVTHLNAIRAFSFSDAFVSLS